MIYPMRDGLFIFSRTLLRIQGFTPYRYRHLPPAIPYLRVLPCDRAQTPIPYVCPGALKPGFHGMDFVH